MCNKLLKYFENLFLIENYYLNHDCKVQGNN